jgi:predicted phosphodiesterase
MQPLYLVGDIHGDIGVIIRFLMINDVTEAGIIQVGDFGIGFHPPKEEEKLLGILNQVLENRQVKLHVIRGNHDNPACFRDGSKNKSHITFLPDYSVLRFFDKNFLCIGGALSIDRSNREAGKDYWYREGFVFDEERIKQIKNIDIVVSHSSPDVAFPFDMGGVNHEYFRRDPTLRSDLAQERINLTKAYYLLREEASNKLSHWFYGHFHQHHEMQVDNTLFVLLNIDEVYKFPLDK